LLEIELKAELRTIIVDKSIPLEDRWNLFIESELGEHDGYYQEPPGINWNKKTLYDDFNCDKYNTLHVDIMLERALEGKMFETLEDEIAFKEYFLENFIKSFQNDW